MAEDKQSVINSEYPITSFRYKATIGGDEVNFSEISGLDLEYESTEYKEATSEGVKTIQVVGQRNIPTVTLKEDFLKRVWNCMIGLIACILMILQKKTQLFLY